MVGCVSFEEILIQLRVFAIESGCMRWDLEKNIFLTDNRACVCRIRGTLMSWQDWNESRKLNLEAKFFKKLIMNPGRQESSDLLQFTVNI